MPRAYIAIGSNLGDRQGHISAAHQALARLPGTIVRALSPIYETEPLGPIPQGKYLNAAACLDTALAPLELLSHLDRIEQDSGREPHGRRVKWGPRTLDLDILLYDNQVISSDRLIVPHPLMHERWFVLKPLADIDPNLVHPVLEMTVGELLKYLEPKGTI